MKFKDFVAALVLLLEKEPSLSDIEIGYLLIGQLEARLDRYIKKGG
jgi:hypothetical protein